MKKQRHDGYAAMVRAVEYLERTQDSEKSPYELRQEQPRIYAAWLEKALYNDCRA